MENVQLSFELGEKNILEDFYVLIEKHRLDSNSDFQLGDFYDFLVEFDSVYQKYCTNRARNAALKYIDKWLRHSLYLFLVLFKFRGFSDRPLFYAFKRFIHWYRLVLESNQELVSEFFFSKNFSENFPSLTKGEYVRFLKEQPINFNLNKPKQFESYYGLFEDAEDEISHDFGLFSLNGDDSFKSKLLVFGDDFSVKEFIVNSENEIFEGGKVHYLMTLDLSLENSDNDGSRLITALSLLINSISNIEGVKVEIESIEVGSLYARIKIYLRDLVAKEETKAVLETSKEALVNILTGGNVSYSEVKKSNAETAKINKELELIEKEIESKPSEFESRMSNALDLERKALENEQLKILIAKEKLDMLSRLSDLAVKGMLDVDDMRIDINEILYLLKKHEKVEASEIDIDTIT